MPEPAVSQSDRENLLLAPYAMTSAASRGRVHREPGHPYRNAFQRDRDRIVHSSAFRRLAHKTQVFIGDMGDYHRTRLTHTLEVASIARTIGRTLRLHEDLIEALALAHDIGHPPFGHAGEDVLDVCLSAHGGFNHNRQALRIVELLEIRYPAFAGLNLTYETLEGQQARAKPGKSSTGTAAGNPPLLEVQTVDASDSIAYDAHDADDAVELGLLPLNDLEACALWREAARRTRGRYAALPADHFRRAVVHELLDLLVSDLILHSSRRLDAAQFASPDEVKRAPSAVIGPSGEMAELQRELEAFLFARVYRHPDVLAQRARAGDALRNMFNRLLDQPELVPEHFRRVAAQAGEGGHRAAADYLACMTDRLALEKFADATSP